VTTFTEQFAFRTKPAPGDLRVIQGFVNTIDFEDGTDRIGGPQELGEWLAGSGLMTADAPVDEGDVELAHEVREALRALLHANNGEELEPGAIETLKRASESAPVVVSFDDSGSAGFAPAAPGVAGALGQLLGIVHTAMADGNWDRLKACKQHTCQWAFYDRSKNRSGSWCTMEICGNRAKARAYRERRRPE
jgi:predicted RNA-binding Zn ribbon-like protein